MVQTLEAVEVRRGSMKVGTTGTIGVLMSRELDSVKSAPKPPASCRKKPPSICSFTAGSATSPKRVRPKASSNEASSSRASNGKLGNQSPEASSSRSSNGKGHKSPEIARRPKSNTRKAHEIPILESETSSVDETPGAQKAARKGLRMVEIVDIKCGSSEKPRASPIKNPLKKLSFSKLSGTL